MAYNNTQHVIQSLKHAGWIKIRTKGSHSIYQKNGISVPIKETKKEIPKGTLSSIEKITGLNFR